MRMAANQFICDVAGNLLEIKRAALPRELTMKDDLQQQVTQFLSQLVIVPGFDSIKQFIHLFHRVPAQ